MVECSVGYVQHRGLIACRAHRTSILSRFATIRIGILLRHQSSVGFQTCGEAMVGSEAFFLSGDPVLSILSGM
jgi:hypothetical protein